MNNPSRRSNRQDLLGSEILVLLGHGPLNRSEIAAQLGLGAATVSEHTRRLLALGYVRELPAQVVGRGRPRVPLAVVPDAAYTLGLRIHPTHVVGVVLRLDGSEVRRLYLPFDPNDDPVEQIVTACTDVLGEPAVGDRIRGIGIALPGIIDPWTGTARLSPRLGWTNLPLGPMLSARLPVPVLVDNDTRASTTAELLYGIGRDHDDFLTLAIGDGVGMGIVLDRRVHRGPDGLASEFGHVTLDLDGPACPCGKRGCVEAYVADHALAAQAVAQGLATSPPTVAELHALAEAGNSGVRTLLHASGAILGRAVAGVVNVLAVRAMTVIGESNILWPYLAAGFTEAIDACVVLPLAELEVTVRPWDDSAHARGAASLVLAAAIGARR
ncbi:ROK family protein [Streptomyces sp. NPDC020917]|uniref:ROK family protein n=1 Tax=Streptomyces sp. NPDC020917 TaxID=3365102 RepID=UPI003788BC22